jgi:hypothetical protein
MRRRYDLTLWGQHASLLPGLLVNIAHMGKDGLRPKRTGYPPGRQLQIPQA